MEIQDQSNDKQYFTIIPNYIANHSSANDQALYFQMKRYAGEKGKCFASEKLLLDKLKIGRKSLKNSIQYLLDHKWISLVGEKRIETAGGKQARKVYIVNDIWHMNNEYYKGVAERTPLKDKGVFQRTSRGVPKNIKGVLSGTTKKNNIQEEQYNNILQSEIAEDKQPNQINQLIEKFKPINPSFKRLYPNKSQRSALDRMIKEHGFDKLSGLLDVLPEIVTQKYAPTVTTPITLENKLGDLMLFINKNKKIGVIKV